MKAPILSRTLCLARLRDGTLRLLDFQLVTTSLGGMIEPRPVSRACGSSMNEDPYDSAYTDIVVLDGAGIAAVPGIDDVQWPRTFNTQ